MKRWLIAVSFTALASAAQALPTVADVQSEVQKGNYTQAQTMMREVVEAKPGSAKAHYIYAEILAHNARFADAAEQANLAKQLDPSIKFTDAAKFRSFQQLLDKEQQRAQPRVSEPSTNVSPLPRNSSPAVPSTMPASLPAQQNGGIPVWVWVGIAALAFIGWRVMRGRSMTTAGSQPAGPQYGSYGQPMGYNNPVQGYGPGGGVMQPGRGSGMMGVGLAAAGGLAAGVLAEKLLHGDHGGNGTNPSSLDNGGNFYGGNAFSPEERDQATRELENRNVDFGPGNDWSDAGSSSDAGGSFDTGSSGGGDDW